MTKKITIAIDAMGGDNSPKKTVEGVCLFIKKNSSQNDFLIRLYGDEQKINNELSKFSGIKNLEIIHTNSIVSDDETPLTAIKNSKNTSMWNCINSQLNNDTDISLSAGNTGVLLVISRMILKTMTEVNKPALAGLWPNQNGMNVVLDLGANIECNEENLIDFADSSAILWASSSSMKSASKGISVFHSFNPPKSFSPDLT